jgi:hypothetical protein
MLKGGWQIGQGTNSVLVSAHSLFDTNIRSRISDRLRRGCLVRRYGERGGDSSEGPGAPVRTSEAAGTIRGRRHRLHCANVLRPLS